MRRDADGVYLGLQGHRHDGARARFESQWLGGVDHVSDPLHQVGVGQPEIVGKPSGDGAACNGRHAAFLGDAYALFPSGLACVIYKVTAVTRHDAR